MKAKDKSHFQTAMRKEFTDHGDRKHWKIIPIEDVPDDIDVLDSVWAFKRKREILTGQIYKYKARLNIHGGQQTYGENFFETYSPVVSWTTCRILLLHTIVHRWHSRQVDFVLAYPQADIDIPLYMKMPHGIKVQGKGKKTHVLKLEKNLYGAKQAGKVWHDHLTNKLKSIGFIPSKCDPCLYYRNHVMFFFYVDDGIFISKHPQDVEAAIADLRHTGLDLEDRGSIADYLGINFRHKKDGSIFMSQPHLIDQLIRDIGLNPKSHLPSTPAISSYILQRDETAAAYDSIWSYRSVIGKLNYLEKGTRPDITYATHQCARFTEDPRKPHAKAVDHIIKYLKKTKHQGIFLTPEKTKSLEVYADADFSGNWYKDTSIHDASTTKSRTGFLIMYVGCPILWCSKLQTQVTLSTTEAEYVSLSHSLREVIPLINLLKEMEKLEICTISDTPNIFCKAFEDNSGALELAKSPKMRPRTKHINLAYHHFREHVRLRIIQLFPITTDLQLADIFTKPLPRDLFEKFRKQIMGW